jgi:hypothetical protein
MKTAMQELIDYATEKYGSNSDIANDLICEAMILKKEERKQICDSNDRGYLVGTRNIAETANDYYEETYKK